MSHIALYRSWRPQTFGDVVGQDHIIQTLQNSLAEGRLTHAYLFSGPRGTGKTTAAKLLAKAVNCLNGPAPEPCNTCDACRRISDGAVMDVIELDAASNNGVDEIRDIRDKVKYAPTEVRYKVYIIDEVHMLTIGAFNALLKTLEEPPAHVIFILATTEPHKLPVTIISRCQRYDFRRVSLEAQLSRLQLICTEEGIEADEQALKHIARLSDGGMRDALSLLDQIVAYTGHTFVYADVIAITGSIAIEQFQEMAEALQRNELGAVLDQIELLMQEGKSVEKCLESFIHFYRDILMVRMLPDASLVLQGGVDEGLRKLATLYRQDQLFMAVELLNHFAGEMKYSAHPGTLLEVAMMQLCAKLNARTEIAELPSVVVERLVQLETRITELETKLSLVGQQGIAISPVKPAIMTSNKTVAGSRGGPPASILSEKRSKSNLEPFVQALDDSHFKQLLPKWHQVLAKVKERKITIHAWLVDGELVSAMDGAILVAFKNTIHRETTEKPDNRQLIEQVIQEIYGQSLSLRTIMVKEWAEATASKSAQQTGRGSGDSNISKDPGILEFEPEDLAASKDEQWINEAIELFGEDLVVIKED
ncbi:MAG: DNA polymerase III subunit gamma/tau [Paenibacillaceae bacterium]